MKKILNKLTGKLRKTQDAASYWTSHNVTSHLIFKDADESLNYFHWRNAQYYRYIELMPVVGQDGKVVVDYGCGPGNDLVGFGSYSKAKKLIGIDVSSSSLQEANHRLSLHRIDAELIPLDQTEKIPLGDGTVDFIHCSGVLHHVANPQTVLQEFNRILAPDGKLRVMVYHYHSIWLHLYVAYIKQIANEFFPNLPVRQAFSKTTDGLDCPISNVFKREEFAAIANEAGFQCKFLGAAVAVDEMIWLPRRLDAIKSRALNEEHREFLASLTFDSQGLPLYKGIYAGIGGCYELSRARLSLQDLDSASPEQTIFAPSGQRKGEN